MKPFFIIAFLFWGIWYSFQVLPHQWPNILNWNLTDSDDITRTLEVRAWLDGQGFYDFMLHRADPPYGSELHWSRISDAPLAIVQIIARLFTDTQTAEYIGVFVTPILLGGVFAIAAAYSAKSILPGHYQIFIAIILVIFFRALGINFTPGRVDHHGLQLIFFALMLMGISGKPPKGAAVAGVSLSISLAIGFELLILQFLCVVWLVLEWLIYRDAVKDKIKAFCIALFISIIAVFLINVAPSHYFDAANERLSIAQLLPISIGSIGLWVVVSYLSDKKITIRILSLGAIAIPVIIFAASFPIMLKPLYWQVSETLYKYWFIDIGETMPLLKLPINKQLILGGFPLGVLIAAVIRVVFLMHHKDYTLLFRFMLPALLLLITFMMTVFFQVRVSLQAAGVSIIIATALLSEALLKLPFYKALAILLILNPFVIEEINKEYKAIQREKAQNNIAQNQQANKQTKALQSSGQSSGPSKCYSKPYYQTLASLPKGLVANNISIGSYTLINTKHDVLSIPFHRDKGRDYLFEIYLSDNATAEKLIRQRGINYIAYCSRAMEMLRIRQYSPNSFMANVIGGNAPEFLEYIPNQTPSDIIIYQVKPQ